MAQLSKLGVLSLMYNYSQKIRRIAKMPNLLSWSSASTTKFAGMDFPERVRAFVKTNCVPTLMDVAFITSKQTVQQLFWKPYSHEYFWTRSLGVRFLFPLPISGFPLHISYETIQNRHAKGWTLRVRPMRCEPVPCLRTPHRQMLFGEG